MPKPSVTPLIDFARQGAKHGVVTQRHRITKEQGEEVRRIEREQGHHAACQHLLKLLFQRPQ
jgi:hypothetical protein